MALLLVQIALLAALVSALLGFAAPATSDSPTSGTFKTGIFLALGFSGLTAVAGGFLTLWSRLHDDFTLPLGLPWQSWQMHLDPLAGFFLLVIGIVTLASALYGPAYVRDLEHNRHATRVLGGFTGLFVLGMELVVVAGDALFFMVAWELMSLSSYFLVAFHHEQAASRRAAFIYLLMAHVSGLAILLSFGVLAGFGGDFTFAALRGANPPLPWQHLTFALALLGFGLKAGLVPLHAWLPEAHPAAPSHISALMSGVMLKVAVYGFIRVVFDLLGTPHWQWGMVALVIGAISALMGVLYALMQHNLKRLLAYHSVENLGIIFMGLGLSLLFTATGHPLAGALGLVAALYHTLNHALFKSLLFFGAGAILNATHEGDLERMGGLLRRMPWTGFCFLVGCISISALPPFNGFVSEWLTFQAALQVWTLDSGALRALVPVAAAMLALTGALAATCFVKVYGIAFLGQARSRAVRRARPVAVSMRLAQGFLATLCLLAGILPTALVGLLNGIPAQLLGQPLRGATQRGWLWLTPIDPAAASYAAPLVLLALLLSWYLASLLLRRRQKAHLVRRAPWDCGFAATVPTPRMQYTATAFAQPIRRVFGSLFRIEETVESNDEGRRHQLLVQDRLWTLLYLPFADTVQHAARLVGRLHSGRVRGYLSWTLVTAVFLLWVAAL